MPAGPEQLRQSSCTATDPERRILGALQDIRPNPECDGGDYQPIGNDGSRRRTGAFTLDRLSKVALEGIQTRLAYKFGEMVRPIPVSAAGESVD
ncbi:hypothetical protein [Bradyrhizobium sp. NBAIM01]|uniref:hypothetical protein n=1 Tax=Bradyrhizobium sp. NBAIM01 TaxID=2793818 RepID=UPI001CD3C618|nr:hypothetical protein [Bradyrhizobium sp. NBAIM01]MCA1515587.1 hypothetical protein [Bradyrhizobium sp. NBAIM01]